MHKKAKEDKWKELEKRIEMFKEQSETMSKIIPEEVITLLAAN